MDISLIVKGMHDKVTAWLTNIGELVPNLVLTVAVLVASWYVARLAQNGAKKAFDRSNMNQAASELLSTLLRVALIVAGVTVALGILELDKALASIIAGAGVVGLALGFAFQDLAANLISGVGLAMNRNKPFQIGDLVESNDVMGRVKNIDLRTSTLETLDGKCVVIPNKAIFQNKVINHSASGTRRVDISCGVSYGDDLQTAHRAALGAINEVFDSSTNYPEPQVFFTEFGDSSINFVARFWIAYESQQDLLKAKSDAIMAIRKALERENLTIPFPIRTLDFGVEGGVQLKQQLTELREAS